MDTFLRRFRRVVWLVGCAGFSQLGHAAIPISEQLTGWSPASGGGWTRNAYNERVGAAIAANRSWAGAAAGASAKIIATDVASIAGRAGALPVSTALSVGLGDAAGAVARCMLGGGLVPGAATAAAAAYAAYRVYTDPTSGGLMSDPGISTVAQQSQGYCYTSSQNTCFSSPDALAQYQYTTYSAPSWKGASSTARSTYTGVTSTSGGVITFGFNVFDTGYSGTRTASFGYIQKVVTTNSCPASIDALNPAYSVAAGSPVGPDGNCPSGRYNHVPTTADAAAARVTAFPPPDITPWVNPTRDAIGSGQQAPASAVNTGPASQTGTPTTTTTTSGTTSSTDTKTPTYTYNYGGDTISYTTTNVTNNTTINNGATTTTTTTTTGAAPTAQDPTDPCTANPTRIGCQPVGDAVKQPDLYKKKSKTFTDVMTAFKTTIQASPLGSAMTGFFTVSLSGGTCPTWTIPLEYFSTTATIDFMCTSAFATLMATFSIVLRIVASVAAFRIAFL
ncbi:MAG: hypothetical protein QFE16_04470 [Pseudomonadota bacterium]|nr:hypothetical protein [Pseudomonadota bacterium]